MWGIWTGEAVLKVHPVLCFFIFCFCMTLVAYLEGLQVAILAVAHDDPENYKISHPKAYKLMKDVREGNNVERFLVGRQFFTIFVMTLIAQVTSFPKISHLGVPSIIWFIFIQTGLPGAVVVTTIGSLQPQLLAAKDPWKFMNLYGACSVLYLCYALEVTGICTHFAYMLIEFLKVTVFVSDKIPKSSASDYSISKMACEGIKYVVSFGVILFFCTYLMFGIWTNQAVLPVPPIAVFIIFCLCGVFLAHLEGLQVAALVQEGLDFSQYETTHPRGYALMKRATHKKNMRRFLIGRQFFVIFVVFLINQCTIFPDIRTFGTNSLVWLVFFQLGFPTALNVLCWFQLPTQLLGNLDPMKFMNRFGPRFTLEVCLFTEITGVAHFSWVVSAFSRATWFRIEKGKTPHDAVETEVLETSGKGNNPEVGVKSSNVHTCEGDLEMHTDISHVYCDVEENV
jgi:hypothetical protein